METITATIKNNWGTPCLIPSHIKRKDLAHPSHIYDHKLDPEKYVVMLDPTHGYDIKPISGAPRNAGHGMGDINTNVGFAACVVIAGKEFCHRLTSEEITLLKK